ncbi:DUF1801 domain-containing protein [Dyadobacter sp. NIV53]|uniref:DUF1801 domain-containing protein n=1 Tax=Dyadobacter sp. NIV53 TaxID=2861765 RepID=UPI001C8820D1|nr:DUF1801 domain-containing protein [Dyadobacter sp. NIV53]
MKEIDNYFLQKEEPVRSCLAALRYLILHQHSHVREVWTYKMPFYYFKKENGTEKRICYLWINKKTNEPYIGIVDGKDVIHPDLVAEKRSRMKIMPIDPKKDLPVEKIKEILRQAMNLE